MEQKEKKRVYHGWIVVEDGGEGFKDYISVEWMDDDGQRRRENGYNKADASQWRGESGCTQAVEWWDRKLNAHVKLEPTLRGCFRVYVEE